MEKNNFLKISAAIFTIFAVIISLFPPFEFGGEKIRTLAERRKNEEIVSKLPVKSYDFIFGGNQKYFALSYFTFQMKFNNEDTLEYFQHKLKDNNFHFVSTSADSFFSYHWFLYKDSAIAKPWEMNWDDALSISQSKIKNSEEGNSHTKDWIDSLPLKGHQNIKENKLTSAGEPNKQDWKTFRQDARTAINYNQVKAEYEKSPNIWYVKGIQKLDSVKQYRIYNIVQHVYYLLDRKILLSELLVEYVIAFFTSLILGYIVLRIPFLRKVCVDIMK